MCNVQGLTGMLRKLCLFALFGFLAVTLAGPVIALLSVILSFALIGFLLWLPLYALFAGREAGWRNCLAKCRAFGERVLRICHGALTRAATTVRGTVGGAEGIARVAGTVAHAAVGVARG